MAQGDPLVLVLLRALYHGAKWTLKAASYTYWFPLYIIHRFVHATLDGSTPAWQTRAVSNPIIFWLTTPIRYFMGVVLFFPTILMYILAGVYCTHVYILRHEQSFFALGLDMELVSKLLTLLFFIILSSPGIANDKDIYKRVAEEFVPLHVQIFTFALSVVALPWMFRVPRFFSNLSTSKTQIDVENACLSLFAGAILDIITVPFAAVILLTGWRAPYTYRKLKEPKLENDHTHHRLHKIILTNGCGVLFQDIPSFLTLPIACLCAPYAIPYKAKELYNAEGNQKYNVALRYLSESLENIPYTLMGIVVVLSAYRGVMLAMNWRRYGNAKIKDSIVGQFTALLLDIPLVLSFTVVFVSGYRFMMLLNNISQSREKIEKSEYDSAVIVPHVESMKMFVEILKDIGALLLAIPVVLTIWRVRDLVKQLTHVNDPSMQQRLSLYRTNIGIVFLEWAIDVPFVICGILSLWRIPVILSRVTTNQPAQKNRDIAVTQFVRALLDIPSAILCIPLLVTVYRFYLLFRMTLETKEETKYVSDYQKKVFYQFVQLLLDLPAFICGILSLWRIPYLIKLCFRADTAKKRRQHAYMQAYDALIDIPFGLSVIILSLSILHIYTLVSYYKKYKKLIAEMADKEETKDSDYRTLFVSFRLRTMKQVPYLPLQLPFIICTYFVVLTGYRIKTTWGSFKKATDKKQGVFMIACQALAIFADILVVLCSVVLFVTVWRAKDIVNIFKTKSLFMQEIPLKEQLATHIEIYILFWHLVRDIPLLLLILLSSFTLWRIGYISQLLKGEGDYKKRLVALAISSLLTLLDIPCFVCTLIVLCSWRSKNIINLVIERYNTGTTNNIHWAIFTEFYQLLVDLPFIILAPFTLWRLPTVIKESMKLDTAVQRRKLVVVQFKEMATDMPYVLSTLFLISTLYRIPDLLAFIEFSRLPEQDQKEEPDQRWFSYRAYIRWKMYETAIDMPIVWSTFFMCCIMPPRFYTLFKALFFIHDDEERRQELLNTSAKSVVDWVTVVFLVLSCIMFWRIPFLIKDLYNGNGILNQIAARQAYAGWMDLIAFTQLLFILYCVQEVPDAYKSLTDMIKFGWNKYTTRKEQERLQAELRKNPKPITEDNGEILPTDLLTEVFTYLEGHDIARGPERVCKVWNATSVEDNRLWGIYLAKFYQLNNYYRPIFKVEQISQKKKPLKKYKVNFKSIVSDAFVDNKSKYAREYKNLQTQKKKYSGVEWDYELGFRQVIHRHFQNCFTWKFFLLPFQIIGLMFIPLHYLNVFRLKRIPTATAAQINAVMEAGRCINFETIAVFPAYTIVATKLLSRGTVKRLVRTLIVMTVSLPFAFFPFWRPRFFTAHNPNIFAKLLNKVIWAWLTIGSLVLRPLLFACAILILIGDYFTPVRQPVVGLINYAIGALYYIFPTYNGFSSLFGLYGFGCNSATPLCAAVTLLLAPHTIPLKIYELVVRLLLAVIQFLFFSEWWISRVLFVPLWLVGMSFLFLFINGVVKGSFPEFSAQLAVKTTIQTVSDIIAFTIATPAKLCYRIGFIGEIILIPITIVWMFWPLYLAYYIGNKSLIVPCIAISIFLFVFGRKVLTLEWNKQKERSKQKQA